MPENSRTMEAARQACERVESGVHAAVNEAEVAAAGGPVPPAPMVPISQKDGKVVKRELFDPVRQAVFCDALRRSPIVGAACRAAGISVATAYRMRKRAPAFAAAWDEALVESVDDIEGELIRRAMDGSDRLLLEANRAYRPELYSPKVDVNVGGQVEFVVDLVPGRFLAEGEQDAEHGVLDAELVETEASGGEEIRDEGQ